MQMTSPHKIQMQLALQMKTTTKTTRKKTLFTFRCVSPRRRRCRRCRFSSISICFCLAVAHFCIFSIYFYFVWFTRRAHNIHSRLDSSISLSLCLFDCGSRAHNRLFYLRWCVVYLLELKTHASTPSSAVGQSTLTHDVCTKESKRETTATTTMEWNEKRRICTICMWNENTICARIQKTPIDLLAAKTTKKNGKNSLIGPSPLWSIPMHGKPSRIDQ